MFAKLNFALGLVLCLLMAGCVTTSDEGRMRMVVPNEVGAVYSEVEVQTKLAFTPDASCLPDCSEADAFRERVWRIAQQLEGPTRQFGQERGVAVPLINVSVPLKDDIGTMSSAAGNVIIFDGLRTLRLSDPALAFLVAREMGHIIGHHHEENTATGLAVSLALSIAFPVVGLLQGAQAAYAATSAPLTLASSVASLAGSRVVRAIYKEDQRREADSYALQILLRAGWTPFQVDTALEEAEERIGDEGWMGELRDSRRLLTRVAFGPVLPDETQLAASAAIASNPSAATSVIEQSPQLVTSESSPPVAEMALKPSPNLVEASPEPVSGARENVTSVIRAKPECSVRMVRGKKQQVCKPPPKAKPALPHEKEKAVELRSKPVPAIKAKPAPAVKPKPAAAPPKVSAKAESKSGPKPKPKLQPTQKPKPKPKGRAADID